MKYCEDDDDDEFEVFAFDCCYAWPALVDDVTLLIEDFKNKKKKNEEEEKTWPLADECANMYR